MAPYVAAALLLPVLLAASSKALLLPEPLQTRPLFSGRAQQTVCVDIPRNLSLCHGVGYTTMRLPNLLEHDTMEEVAQQSAAWIPLMHIGCHVDARLFLCSLFSPVCLERDIWPCRSLCRTVQRGCEGRMLVHGYPWPDIFRCDRFPVDNDMCIPSQNPDPESAAEAAAAIAASSAHNNADAATAAENAATMDADPAVFEAALQHRTSKKRGVCSQSSTFESVVEHLCRAEIAVRARVGHSRTIGNAELIKGPRRPIQRQQALTLLGRPMVLDESCSGRLEPRRAYLIAGLATVKGDGEGRRLNPTIVVPWHAAAKAVKRAISAINNATNCTDSKNVFFVPAVKTKLAFPRHPGRGRKGTTTSTTTTTTTTTTSTTTTTTPAPTTTTIAPTTTIASTTTVAPPTTTQTPSTTTDLPTTTAVPTTTVPSTTIVTTTVDITTTPVPTTTPVLTTTPIQTTTPVHTTSQAPTTSTTTTTTTTTTPAPTTPSTTTHRPSQGLIPRPKFIHNNFRHREDPFLPNSREDFGSNGRSEDVSRPRGRGKKKHRQGKKKKERRRKTGVSTMAPTDIRFPGPFLPPFPSDLPTQPVRRRGYKS